MTLFEVILQTKYDKVENRLSTTMKRLQIREDTF